jgi:FkbH-like protein
MIEQYIEKQRKFSYLDFNSLKKAKKEIRSEWTEKRIAILGDHTTQFIKDALVGYGAVSKMNFNVLEAGYDQIEQQIFDSRSALYEFEPEIIILTNSVYKLEHQFSNFPEKNSFAESFLQTVNAWLDAIRAKTSSKIILFNFPELPDKTFGNYGGSVPSSFIFQLRKINYEFMLLSQKNGNVFILDLAALFSVYGHNFIKSNQLFINADMIFSLDFVPIVTKQISDIVLSLHGKFNKCLILDLDGVMWGGIVGDDGIEKINIGHLGVGKAFSELQSWAKALKERGVILAVCSKNDETNAKEPFLKHPEMVLRLDDISVFLANWNNKVENIKKIQQILNIGFDSMVFLDDNAFERNLVRQLLPDVTVPEMPEDPAEYVDYVNTLNLFETTSFSENDKNRTKQYQAEASRVSAQSQFTNIDDYLISLKMVSDVKEVDAYSLPRVAQLTQRSNQFNLRTKRYTEEDLKTMLQSGSYIGITFTLSDAFGEHGLVSSVILKKEKDKMFIDTWVMSCRVLKRTMEEFILNTIISCTKQNGFDVVAGEYIPTAKNSMVKDLYINFGFTPCQQPNHFFLNVREHQLPKTFISQTQP